MRVVAEEEVKQIEGRRGFGFERCSDQTRETTWEGGRRKKGRALKRGTAKDCFGKITRQRQTREKGVGGLREKNGVKRWVLGKEGGGDCFGKMTKLKRSEKVAKDVAAIGEEKKDDSRETSRRRERRGRCGSLASV